MHQWVRDWLVDGTNVYAAHQFSDYPPHALVVLSPLGLLPISPTIWAWAVMNLGFAIAAAVLAIRVVRPDTRWSELALPVLMFLCWGGFRTLLQFTLITLVLGLLAMRLADRRPIASGLCLGVSLMKPQVAIPFILWAMLTRRWRQVLVALAVPIGGFVIFCLRSGASPFAVALEYLGILGTLYVSDDDLMMVGLSQLRPAIAAVVSNPMTASVIAILVALVLLGLICRLGVSEATRRDVMLVSAPPLAAVWSLLTFYHLTYGFVTLLPVATLLIFMNDPGTQVYRRRMFWMLQLMLMIDIPGAWRRVEPFVVTNVMNGAAPLALHADRVLMAALFVGLTALVRTPEARRPKPEA